MTPEQWLLLPVTKVLDAIALIGMITQFAARLIFKSFTPPLYVAEGLRGMALLTHRCLTPVVVVLFTLGGVMSVQAANLVKLVSAEPIVGGVMSVFTLRELSPVLGAMLIAAQGGTSTATELGVMRIKEEFDAMSLMAVDPERLGVVPRFIAFILAAPLLCIIGNAAGVIGGFAVTMMVSDMSSGTFYDSVISTVTLLDVWNGVIKSTIFGLTIGSISCYFGYHVRGGPVEVGQAANKSVVYSLMATLALNYLVTTALFGATAMGG